MRRRGVTRADSREALGCAQAQCDLLKRLFLRAEQALWGEQKPPRDPAERLGRGRCKR